MSTLLIVTQKVNVKDDVLGFFHGWLIEFAKKWEKVTVICLEEGEHNLPQNVSVLSLGKEKGLNKIQISFNFLVFIWKYRKNYQSVFVHMNQEYVLLAGIFWRLWNKKISLWRNHAKGNFLTSISVFLSHNVFCTSEFSFTRQFKKTKVMSAGIDVNFFRRLDVERKPRSLLYLGRISPVKKIGELLDAVMAFDSGGVSFSFSIYGDPTSADKDYYDSILKKVAKLKGGKIKFHAGISHDKTARIYNSCEILVNSTPTGSFDKVVLEMMACEGLVITSNRSFAGIGENGAEMFVANEKSEDLRQKIKKLLNLSKPEKEVWGRKLRDWVVKNHSLKKLAEDLQKII